MTEPELRDAFVDGLVTREEYIRRSGGTSEWLRNALTAMDSRDIIDMARDIDILRHIVLTRLFNTHMHNRRGL